MSTRRIPVHPAQIAELLTRKNAADAAQARFADAAAVLALGAGILEGELQEIDTDRNELVIKVTATTDALELEPTPPPAEPRGLGGRSVNARELEL